ncbi:transcriptional repressor TraM [Rhizobium sp. G187]|uniref:transcriptional repressor TraM n=1 Tax=Rhizobium sp. G187 TaxID=3451352 RepID=UPI003EE59BB4
MGVNEDGSVELKPLVGLLAGVPEQSIEQLTVEAIKTHRSLVEKAENLFQALPPDVWTGKVAGGAEHLAYLNATIEMHAQMSVLSTLIAILGRTPNI